MKTTSSFRTVIRTGAVMFVAVAAMFVMSQSASAQSCGYGGYGGGFHGGYGGGGLTIGIGNRGYGYGGGLNIGYSSYRPTYRPAIYHNTSHYDYHPGGFVRHGNHFDYRPGHYDLHRTGHWHR